MWLLLDVTLSGCDYFWMWLFLDVTISGCDSFWMWLFLDVTTSGCEFFWMWLLLDVTTSGCDYFLSWKLDVTTSGFVSFWMWLLLDVTTSGCDCFWMWLLFLYPHLQWHIKMPLKHYLSSQSGRRLAERSGNYLFGTSTIDFMSRDVFCLTRSAQRLPAKLSLATSSPARRNARSVEIRRLPTGEQGVLNHKRIM